MPGSSDFLKDLNQPKVYELKKAFCLFDLDGDGVISEEDVRNTFLTLGVEKSDAEIIKMFDGVSVLCLFVGDNQRMLWLL